MAMIHLGFNCNCFTNRYDEPEAWTAICRQLGIRHVMFNVDLIDPYWPWELQRSLADRTLAACRAHGITIVAGFGGHHGHQHYLGHPEPAVRREAERWFARAIRLVGYLGGGSFGTCFAIQTVAIHSDPAQRQAIIEDALAAYGRLAAIGKEHGLSALAYEMTSVPRETCATFAENDYVLEQGRRFDIPLRVCLDLGHRNLAGTPEEADHLAWIRRYGRVCDVIDCQQTDMAASRHWPFTPEQNARGVIRGDEVVQAIHDSGADTVLLAFELRAAAFHPQEHAYLGDLAASVAYWRTWVKD
ncbi:MAG: TIM barrel protein [Armatimonadetes bacterium]|nr:TIM barrel protein [Armatimonadota bacterium]